MVYVVWLFSQVHIIVVEHGLFVLVFSFVQPYQSLDH